MKELYGSKYDFPYTPADAPYGMKETNYTGFLSKSALNRPNAGDKWGRLASRISSFADRAWKATKIMTVTGRTGCWGAAVRLSLPL